MSSRMQTGRESQRAAHGGFAAGLASARDESRALDWDANRLLKQLSPAAWLGLQQGSLAMLRRNWQLCVKAFATREPVARIEAVEIDRGGHIQKLRIYHPEILPQDALAPALIWYHGGGFVFGDLYTAGAMCRKLSNETGCAVIAVQYRLAPEHALETSIGDCCDAYAWIAANARRLRLDPARLMVGGDSAGGALAALVAQRARGADMPEPVAQLLVYPATNLAIDHGGSSTPEGAQAQLLAMFKHLQAQISERTDLTDSRLSPVHAPDLAGLPQTVMLTTGFDPLLGEGLDYAGRLADSGVPVRLIHCSGQFHGFLSFDAVLQSAQVAFERIGAAVRAVTKTGQIEAGFERIEPSAGINLLWWRPAQRWKETIVICLLSRDIAARALGGVAEWTLKAATIGWRDKARRAQG